LQSAGIYTVAHDLIELKTAVIALYGR
jgi:hypothetical protein